MKRSLYLAATISVSLHPWTLLAESHFTAPPATVGYHLEQRVKITFDDFAPDDGLPITVKSSDPKRLLISKAADQPGAESIVVQANSGSHEAPFVWLQAMDKSGKVEYTAEAKGFAKGVGTVTLTPSAILIVGPLKQSKFLTTTGAVPSKITLHAVRLDEAGKKDVEDQPLAGDALSLDIANNNESFGRTLESHLSIAPGRTTAGTQFKPSAAGDVTLSIKPPAGFNQSPEFTEVTASVRKPALGLADRQMVGQNLQIAADVLLGEYAPETGLIITITSDDPSKLLLSASSTEVGTKTIEVKVAPNGTSGHFFLQALAASGSTDYTATAPGFRTRKVSATFAPSGVVITPVWQGPPDEAQLFRAHTATDRNSKFLVSLAKGDPMNLIVWTARLDPVTHRCADITVEPLRAGYSITVAIQNSNPSVGEAETEIKIGSGSDHGVVHFKPKALGNSEISVVTPKDFTTPENSTMTTAFVQK
jgi:hypothetical protein